MDCVVTPLKTLMGFSVHLNVQLKFYNLPYGNKGVYLINNIDRLVLGLYNRNNSARFIKKG